MAGIGVAAQGAEQLKTLSRNLRQAGRGDLRARLRDEVSTAGKPVLEELRRAVLTLPVKGTPGGGSAQRRAFAHSKVARRRAGLRASIARATKLSQTANGIRFVVSASGLPPDQRSLPRHLDSAAGWRHPLFGDTTRWYPEVGRPWFAATIIPHAGDFRAACLRAMNGITRELEGSG